jgi:hypothetical protein
MRWISLPQTESRSTTENIRSFKGEIIMMISGRRIAIERDKGLCIICKQPATYNRQSILVHHIDGNRYNNKPENLACLCNKHHTEWHCKVLPKFWRVYQQISEIQEINMFFESWSGLRQ